MSGAANHSDLCGIHDNIQCVLNFAEIILMVVCKQMQLEA